MEIEVWDEYKVYAYDTECDDFIFDSLHYSKKSAINKAKKYKNSYVIAVYSFRNTEIVYIKNCAAYEDNNHNGYYNATILSHNFYNSFLKWVCSLVKI